MNLSPIYKHVGSFQTLALMNTGHMDTWNKSYREHMYAFWGVYRICMCSALIDVDSLPQWLSPFLTVGCESSLLTNP